MGDLRKMKDDTIDKEMYEARAQGRNKLHTNNFGDRNTRNKLVRRMNIGTRQKSVEKRN